jgi:hypothetical protein
MNLCRDCKHIRISWLERLLSLYGGAMCSKAACLVSGKPERYCSIMRDKFYDSLQDQCGSDGKWFEPKREKP